FFFLDVEPSQIEEFKEIASNADTARALNITPSLRGRIVEINGIAASKALVDKNESWVINSDRGFTYTSTLPSHSEVIEGEWWGNAYEGAPIVSIATNVQRAFNIGVGDEITVNILGRNIVATVANVRDVSWGSFTLNFAVTFAPNIIKDIPSNYIATIIVDEDKEEALQNKL
ncbi:MAG: ABC transporter permease, partial [Planctomycetes bacterium]|nr:ABC transporter permease [Planctomycetota bacterium]